MLAAPVTTNDWLRRRGAAHHEPTSLADRYGLLAAEASTSSTTGRDFIFLGVIDWSYRIQRPQHLAMQLADVGNRIFYVSVAFGSADADGRFRILHSPYPGVFELRLRLTGDAPLNIYAGFTKGQAREMSLALDEARTVLGIRAPILFVEYPSWYPVAIDVPGATLVYDCLDLMAGFGNVTRAILQLEEQLIRHADLFIVASTVLANHFAPQRASVVVRNAADVEFFGGQALPATRRLRPVIGYFGAIAEWFAIEWLVTCARAHPEWDFVLIGEIAGADITSAKALKNIAFLGEKPYRELPKHLSGFDVAIIPFKMSKLIECVNPVKLYEYMSQGKSVVSCAMPEVIASTDLAYIAHDEADFERQIVRALAEDSPELQARRRSWALQHTWRSRADAVELAISSVTPLVSVVVLTYNNLDLTRACLHSLLTLSDYPNLELIVVDNASSDETPRFIKALARRDPRVRPILNTSNIGFAAGNNVGLRHARGDYIIILNNDTYVTRGWVRDLIRPLMLDPAIGVVGPLTNNIGNEQKVATTYSSTAEMASAAREFTRQRPRARIEVSCVAFFCVAMRRSLLDEVGFLDEAYGIGFYEDDDYCRRLAAANYRIIVADDVFVHHELSAAFKKIPSEDRVALMARNKAIFEERWGPWTPHRYRDEPGFGA